MAEAPFRTFKNGKTEIEFYRAQKRGDQALDKFTFSVKGNPELTVHLHNAVKKTRVKENEIEHCVKALFQMIESNAYTTAHDKGEDISSLYEKFQQKNGCSPKFEFTDTSNKDRPSFLATLTNGDPSSQGEGRTKQQARVEALRKYFGDT